MTERVARGTLTALVVPLMVLCGALASDGGSGAVVRVGEWQIRDGQLSAGAEPWWEGEATAPGDRYVEVCVVSKPLPSADPHLSREFTVPDIGTVRADAWPGWSERTPGPKYRAWMTLSVPSGGVFLECTWPSSEFERPPGSEPGVWEAEQNARLLDEAAWSPAFDLLKLLAREKVELDRRVVAKAPLEVSASVDGAEFVFLQRARKRDYSWLLPARPGQRIELVVQFQPRRYVVTTRGIEWSEDLAALAGAEARIHQSPGGTGQYNASELADYRTAGFDDRGAVRLSYGPIGSERELRFVATGWKEGNAYVAGTLLLRWGRSEEQRLDSGRFPLAPPPRSSSHNQRVRAILSDLEAAWDPDRASFFRNWGSKWGSLCRLSDRCALRGLDLSAFPHLSSAVDGDEVLPWFAAVFPFYVQENDPRYWEHRPLARELAEALVAQAGKWGLARPFAQFRGETGWHGPREVYGLAVLRNKVPKVGQAADVQAILDYWVKAISERALPVRNSEGGSQGLDDSPESLGYAAAALHLGWQDFHKPEYAHARDLVMDAMRSLRKGESYYEALAQKKSWRETRDPPGPDSDPESFESEWQAMCPFVSIYGQTCAFIGDEVELRKAQDWIKAALMREGPEGDNPFRNYRAASFGDRCGMIAVLRGKAAYLEVPDFPPQ